MVVYWSLFAYFALGAMLNSGQSGQPARRAPMSAFWAFGILLIILAIGLRYRVGADWFPYARMYAFARYADLGKMLTLGDPGYQLLNWLIQRAGLGLWMVNLVCACIFSWGLARFARRQPDPWLVVVVAIPYLVVVGEKEKQAGQVAVRARGGQDLGVMTLEALLERIGADVSSRGLSINRVDR